jgi:integrase
MASIRRHPVSDNWNVRYRDPSGKQRSKTFKRQVDARAFASDVDADMRRGTYIDPQAGEVTFGRYADRWIATRTDKARTTQDRDASYLRSMILPTFGRRQVATIQTSEVEEWLAGLERADTTRTKALQILRSVLDLARRDRALAVNPATDVKPPGTEPQRTGRALSDKEVAALLEAAEQVDESTAGVVWLMARAGLRIGEALAVQRDDIDLVGGVLHVRRSLTRRGDVVAPKGRKRHDQGRTIPLPPDLTERLRRHLAASSVANIDGFVFTATRGGAIRYGNWRRRVWSRITDEADVDALPHDLRHTAATRLFTIDRWNPAEVQRFLGHRDPRVTLAIYTHVSSEDLPAPSRLAVV